MPFWRVAHRSGAGADRMISPPKIRSVASLTASGVASLVVSLLGLFMGLWGGSKSPYPVFFSFFWILPALSLPVFGVYFLSNRLGRLLSVLLAVGIYTTLFLSTWRDCMVGQCTATNVATIALSPFTWINHLWVQIVAALFLNLAYWKRHEVHQDDKHTTQDPGF
jgi:hypothetical protein